MIAVPEFIAAVDKVTRKMPVYNPDQRVSGRMPATMRELIEGNFDNPDGYYLYEGPPLLTVAISDAAAVCRSSAVPIRPGDLDGIKRPLGPAKVQDYRVYYMMLAAFYGWLKKKGLHKSVNIEHSLCGVKSWPLLVRFEKELKKRTGYPIDAFCWGNWSEPNMDGDTDRYSCEEDGPYRAFYMPLYDGNSDGDDVLLFEFLSNPDGNFPEPVRDAAEEAGMADFLPVGEVVFQNILKTGQLQLLPRLWRNAIKALQKYEYGLYAYSDPEECRIEIDGADSIDTLFEVGRDVCDFREGMDPLVSECYQTTDKFWNDFLKALYEISKKHPELARDKTKTAVQH